MKTMEEQYMIRHYWEQGLSKSAISRETGHDRKTIRKYLLTGEIKSYKKRKPTEKLLDPYKGFIKSRLEEFEELSAERLFEDIQEQGYKGGYSTVRDYVRVIRPSIIIQAEYRYETKPGIQSQADWGTIGDIFIDGEKRTLYCFTMILGYSRMRYVEFTLDMKTETFIQCHLNAFEFFGGITREILYDNTKNVVLHRALKANDSTWNPMFEDLFKHFGFLPRLCKPGKEGAKTKGKVEALVKYVKKNFYLGRDYESIPDLNSKAYQWMLKVNAKPHGTTKIPPIERLKEEKLNPFDKFSPFQIVRTETRKISRDCYFSYLGNLYSVPWKYAGHPVTLRIQNNKMMVFVNGENICQHTCREGRGTTVRVSEHFEGLLKKIRGRNEIRHEKRIESLKIKAPVVENRPLVQYDIYMEDGPDGR
jgi:transposase